jgi:glycosyltransferase involved in cell wall biosynthesis
MARPVLVLDDQPVHSPELGPPAPASLTAPASGGRRRPIVLIFARYYLPGFLAGGPIRSLANLVQALGDEFDFRIVTLDRDAKARAAYSDVHCNVWTRVGKALVIYCPLWSCSPVRFARIIHEIKPDAIYLNSLFDPVFTSQVLLLRRMLLAPSCRIVIAPRGECSPGALSQKRSKKRVFLQATKLLHLHHGLIWQASSTEELKDIYTVMGSDQQSGIAQDIQIVVGTDIATSAASRRIHFSPGRPRRFIFLARIVRMKNLDFAIRCLEGLKCPFIFDIYGPIEDAVYWEECQRLIADTGLSASITYCGSVTPDEVPNLLTNYDFLLLPTLGENYGHVIVEALSSGVPVVISDRTPWTAALRRCGGGWPIPLEEPDSFIGILRSCCEMSISKYRHLSGCAVEAAANFSQADDAVAAHRALLGKSPEACMGAK